ncbi:MAG: 23S rRNA (adenine(2030)-N(6))-methyltransferase RlmJ [Parvibaculum sp.]
MLSYQHMYHAGGLADVHKHAVLTLMLARFIEKPKPLTYVETHAGRGLYDLSAPEAGKTGEAAEGITRLLKGGKLHADHPYARMLVTFRATHGESAYPGSPLIAGQMLRAGDRMHLCELHPKEVVALRAGVGRRAQIQQKDGYADVLRRAPFDPRRGFVLIDPSYEVKSEYEDAADFVLALHAKWPVATILLWYPVLERGLHLPMLACLREADLPKVWEQQVSFDPARRSRALGSGLFAVNTPFGIEDPLADITKLF